MHLRIELRRESEPGAVVGKMVTVLSHRCKCRAACSMGKVKKEEEEKGGTEVTLLSDRCTLPVVQAEVQVKVEVVKKKKEAKGDFGERWSA